MEDYKNWIKKLRFNEPNGLKTYLHFCSTSFDELLKLLNLKLLKEMLVREKL